MWMLASKESCGKSKKWITDCKAWYNFTHYVMYAKLQCTTPSGPSKIARILSGEEEALFANCARVPPGSYTPWFSSTSRSSTGSRRTVEERGCSVRTCVIFHYIKCPKSNVLVLLAVIRDVYLAKGPYTFWCWFEWKLLEIVGSLQIGVEEV